MANGWDIDVAADLAGAATARRITGALAAEPLSGSPARRSPAWAP